MDYDRAVKEYLRLRQQIDKIESDASAKIDVLKEKQAKLAEWMDKSAKKDGLETIKTSHGTAFWVVVDSVSVSNRTAFFDYCRKQETWELLEARASKLAVRDFLKTHNTLPPGVDYTTKRNINVRSKA